MRGEGREGKRGQGERRGEGLPSGLRVGPLLSVRLLLPLLLKVRGEAILLLLLLLLPMAGHAKVREARGEGGP
jgi:hypothetical protein